MREEALKIAEELDELDINQPTDVCSRAANIIRRLVDQLPKKDLQSEIDEAMRILGLNQ